MRTFRIKTWEKISYPEDVARIGRILYERDYLSTPEQCLQLWLLYSDSVCAGWIILPEDDKDVYQCIKHYIAED